MRKRFDYIFFFLMLSATVAVALIGVCFLSNFTEHTKPEAEFILVASAHIEVPVLIPEPTPVPTQTLICYPSVPLDSTLQVILCETCEAAGVPVPLALGVIEVESCFQVDAVSPKGCYGLMQLNPRFFPDKLSPADNLREGIGYLGRLLERYGDSGAALTAYNTGSDTGSRAYASAVLAAAGRWEEVLLDGG